VLVKQVLIIEDGDEYLENLSHFLPGLCYLQAHSGAEALKLLKGEKIDLIYLDMRFDRSPRESLWGDHARITREQNGSGERAWRYLANNQGLFILAHLHEEGWCQPTILSYDFSREPGRWRFLSRRYPQLAWLPDTVTSEEIRRQMDAMWA